MTSFAVLARVGIASCAALLAAVPGPAQAAEPWPSRPVQIVVPFTPGTGADILARTLGPKLAERWGVAVVVDNRQGASGNIGAEIVAKSPPDGETLLCTATTFGTNPAVNTKIPYDPIQSFEPVALIATNVTALLVNPRLPVTTVRDFIALAKKEPGKLYYASPGNGTPQHLAMELLKLRAGIDLVHVPYKGTGGALTDLVAGHVQAMVVPLQTGAPYVRSGKLRMLGVMSAERSSAFPEVPTFKEEGVPDIEVDTWYGLLAPAGTPREVVEKINADVNALLADTQIRDFLAKQGLHPAGGPPERFAALLKSEVARWRRVVAAAGIKAD